jgi:hypothetical protein
MIRISLYPIIMSARHFYLVACFFSPREWYNEHPEGGQTHIEFMNQHSAPFPLPVTTHYFSFILMTCHGYFVDEISAPDVMLVLCSPRREITWLVGLNWALDPTTSTSCRNWDGFACVFPTSSMLLHVLFAACFFLRCLMFFQCDFYFRCI